MHARAFEKERRKEKKRNGKKSVICVQGAFFTGGHQFSLRKKEVFIIVLVGKLVVVRN
jgi:hypothetical protein